MIKSFDDFILGVINEAAITPRLARKTIHGVLNTKAISMLRKLLRHNIVMFKFIKRDGTIRRAKGTLHPAFLPALRGGAPKVLPQMVYYDLDKHHWRSFRTFKFIKLVDIKEITSSTLSSLAKSYEEEDDEILSKTHVEDVDYEKEAEKKEAEKEAEKKKKHSEETHHSESHSDEHSEEDEHKKTYKAGDKIPEKELLRRSSDLRKGTIKNKTTKEANDKFKSGELDDEKKPESKPEEKKENKEKSSEETHNEHSEHKEEHKEDEHKKTYKAGDKIPEDELMRRSSDFRKGTHKNKTTKEANDKFKSEKKDKKQKDNDKNDGED